MKPLLRCLLASFIVSPLWAAPAADIEERAEDSVEAFCARHQGECGQAKSLLEEAQALAQRIKACRGGRCGLQEYDSLNADKESLYERILALEHEAHGRLVGVLYVVGSASRELLRGEGREVEKSCSELDERLTGLEGETGALERAAGQESPSRILGRVRALGREGAEAFDSFLNLSISIDHAGSGSETKVMAMRDRANHIALHLAQLRDRLIALQARCGEPRSEPIDVWRAARFSPKDVPPRKGDIASRVRLDGIRQAAFDGAAARRGLDAVALAGPGAAALAQPSPLKTLLDAPGALPPVVDNGRVLRAPAILPKGGLRSGVRLESDEGDMAKADMMRRMGLTETIGDPGGLAKCVHRQTGGTCAIVSQQEILQAYGLLPSKNPSKIEAELKREAIEKGYFQVDDSDPNKPEDLGTPTQYVGNLAMERGVIMTKHAKATLREFDAAVERGKPIIVGVDPGVLWNDKRYLRSGHAIVVTGAEVAKARGKILGYYVNDSGDQPPGKGRFVPAAQFHKAWEADGSWFGEVR